MAEAKFKPTGQDVMEYIESVEPARKKADAYELLEIFEEISGFEPKMWYPNIVGFGQYHYKTETGLEGEAIYLGFAPRKAKHTLYLDTEFEEKEELLAQLGKHTTGKMCIYINKLADVDVEVLKKLIKSSLAHTKAVHPDSSE